MITSVVPAKANKRQVRCRAYCAAICALARLRERARTPLPHARMGEGLAEPTATEALTLHPARPLIHALSRKRARAIRHRRVRGFAQRRGSSKCSHLV